jgi:hypothetical protein
MYKKILFLAFLVYSCPAFNSFSNEPITSKPALIYERIQVNTDRKLYIAGENLLFNLYLVDTKTNALATYPSIGYVTLKNIHGTIVGKSQVKINAGQVSGAIYLSDTLQSGYYQIEAFTNFMRNGSSDNFFRTQVMVANRFDKDLFGIISGTSEDSMHADVSNGASAPEKISVVPVKTEYGKREQTSFKVIINDAGLKFASLTVAVVEKNPVETSFVKKATRNIRTSKAVLLNNTDSSELPVFLAEDKYAELMGRLTNAENGRGLANHALYLSSPDTVANLNYTVTDSKGFFRFALHDYYNGKDLFIKVKKNANEIFTPKITIDSKYSYEQPFTPEFWPVDSSTLSYIRNSQDIVRIQKSYLQVKAQQEPVSGSNSFIPYLYKVPNFVARPADFLELKDFTEIAREIIPPLRIRKRNNVMHAEIIDYNYKEFMEAEPLILVDGVIIDNINQLLPYGSKDIRKVEVISSKWYVDLQELNGVIGVFSNNNLWKNISLNSDYNLKMKASEYFDPPKVLSPNYAVTDINSWEPDFRQLLYWNPNLYLKRGESPVINFYTSDYATSYVIKVRGIANNGELIEAYGEIKVND